MKELNRDIFRRRFHDRLVLARIREDLDTISNTAKEDKLMISGMISKFRDQQGERKPENGSRTL